MIRISNVFLSVLWLAASSQAWTTTTTTTLSSTRRVLSPLKASSSNNEGQEQEEALQSYHSYKNEVIIKTKTDKTLVFDEIAGRFFETSPLDESKKQRLQQEMLQQEMMIASNFPTDGSNDMVPTQLLFGKMTREEYYDMEDEEDEKYEVVDEEEEDDTLSEMTWRQATDPIPTKRSAPVLVAPSRKLSVVEDCYDAWNRRAMSQAMDCFADQFTYVDGQYLGSFTSKQSLGRHFSRQADLLPPNSQIVVDYVAECPDTGNIATQWHLERPVSSGRMEAVPFTKGCSFYTTNTAGLITSGVRVSEMLVKSSPQTANRLVSSVSRLNLPSARNTNSNNFADRTSSAVVPMKEKSMIEQYFEAWNRRDMDAALACFVEDCVYQVEDPVFCNTFQGKAALRNHLVQNAASLPASCKIILDQIAIDPSNGTIGTRWHLEVGNRVKIPNLSGCSMYTTDLETGLLMTGFDVTEAPIKLPPQAIGSLPSKLATRFLFGGL